MAERRSAARVGNLPAEVSSFVGRSSLIKDARRFLAESRLVTLIGVGGVGKTRLALRLAREVEHLFADGVWCANLADLPALPGSSFVEQTIAEALGLIDFSSVRPRDALAEHLRDRHCLLVVDNCEHLVEEVGGLLSDILRGANNLHVLATSREVLGCVGEYVVHVPPLTIRDVDDSPSTPPGEALELLQQRAIAAGSPIVDAELPLALELCRQLDGIPLAIELAAGRLDTLSIQEVLDRLDDRFRLLTRGARHGPATHRTLRRVMDWSYHLCNDKEKLLWERISIFAGGFDLKSAEDVCAGPGIGQSDVLDILSGLVRQSVLLVEPRPQGTRYRLLETLRQYGLQSLANRGNEPVYRRRHRDHFRRMAAEAADDWFSQREIEWLEWARADLPNLRAAMDFSLTDIDTDASLEMAVNLTRLRIWFFNGWPGEGRAWLQRGLKQDVEQIGPLRLTATAFAGWISLCQGDSQAAGAFLEQCQQAIGNHCEAPPAVGFLEGAYALIVDSDVRAIVMLEHVLQALESARAPDADRAMIELFWSIAAGFLGDRETALAASQQHLENALEHRAEWQISWAQWVSGLAQIRHADGRRALAMIRESLRRQRDMNDRWGTVWGTHEVAWGLAALLSGRERLDEGDIARNAEQIARVLGGAQRLRADAGVQLVGLGPYNTATMKAESVALRVLGEDAYLRAFEEGSFSHLNSEQTYQHILAAALGEEVESRRGVVKPTTHDPRNERLTIRESEIASLVAEGLSNPEIARKLVISDRTVQSHVGNILNKLDLRNRQEIAVWFTRTYPETSTGSE